MKTNLQEIPALINGISRQPPSERLPSQCEEQVNLLSSPADGPKTRPPADYVATLGNIELDGICASHIIERDSQEQYLLIVRNGTLNIWSFIDGSQKTITYDEGALDYLASTDPESDFKFLTVDDTTWIVNKTVTVADAGDIEEANRHGIVYVKRGLKAVKYVVVLRVGSTEYSIIHTTAAQEAGTAAETSTEDIAVALRNTFDTDATLAAARDAFYCDKVAGTLRFRPKQSDASMVRVEDSYGGQALIGFTNEYKNFTDLPGLCFEGHKVRIKGIDDEADYYLEYTESTSTQFGTWRECASWGNKNEIDNSTFPYKLVRQSDGTFHFSPCAVEPRIAGDEDTAKAPHLIGNTIDEISFYNNRLNVFSDDHVSHSKIGDYYRFYPVTVRQALDDDPFEQTTTLEGLCQIKHALPFDRSLLLFGVTQQYQITSKGAFIPDNAVVDPTTNHKCSDICKPVKAGTTAFFVSPNDDHSIIREYYVVNDEVSNESGESTAHIGNYLPNSVFKMSARSANNMVAFLVKDHRNRIYIYSYLWTGTEKRQSSWSYWEFSEGTVIIDCRFIEDKLHLVLQRDGYSYIESMTMTTDAPAGLTYDPHMDSRVLLDNATYDEDSDTTTFTMPYNLDNLDLVAVSGLDTPTPDRPLEIISKSGTDFTVSGDYSTGEIYAGINYTSKYKLSEQYFRRGDDARSLTGKRTQILRMAVSYQNSGDFTAVIENKGRVIEKKKDGLIGTTGLVLDKARIDSGEFTFGVNGENIQTEISLVAQSPIPVNYTKIVWKGWRAN